MITATKAESASAIQAADICPNCGSEIEARFRFCSSCGQKSGVRRLNMHDIWHDLFHAFTHTDKGILFLVRELVLRPGRVAREYVDGKRKKYFNPFSFLVIVVAVSTFLIASFNLMTVSGARDPVSQFLNKHANVVIFLNVPFSALFSWIFFGTRKSNYAENLVLAAYAAGQRSVFYNILFVPLMLLFRSQYFTIVGIYLSAFILYFAWACAQFHRRQNAKGYLLGFLASLCQFLIIYLLIFLSYLIYYSFFAPRA